MPLWLLANWKLILGAAVVATLGTLLVVARLEISALKTAAAVTALDIEKKMTAAQTLLAAAQEHAREVAARNAELNIQLEKDHADAQAKIDSAHDDNVKLSARVGSLLRQRAGSGNCGADRLPGSGDSAGSGPSGTAPGGLPEAVERLIARANDLFREADSAAEVGLRCHAFAVSVSTMGRAP